MRTGSVLTPVIQQLPTLPTEEWFVWLFFAPFLLIGVIGIGKGLRAIVRSYRTASRDPISVADVRTAAGAVEIRGTAHPLDETIEGYDSGEPCLAYTYETSMRNRNKRIEKEDAIPFQVEDDTGSVVVEPAGAKLLLGGMGEHRLDPGGEVHVTGTPTEMNGQYNDHVGDVAIGDGRGAFLIAANDESTTVTRLKWRGIFAVVKSLVWLGFFLFLLSKLGYL